MLSVGRDEWRWRPGEDGVLTVKSCYKLLIGLWLVEGDLSREEGVFDYLWKSRAPTKVLTFVWATLLN